MIRATGWLDGLTPARIGSADTLARRRQPSRESEHDFPLRCPMDDLIRDFGARASVQGTGMTALDPETLTVRPVTMADECTLLEWRNDSETQAASRSTDQVSPQHHHEWLRSSLTSPVRVLLLCEDEAGNPVATVRFDLKSGTPNTYEVSLTVAPHLRGRGLGQVALLAGEHHLSDSAARDTAMRVLAYVRKTNLRSLSLFKSCMYVPTGSTDDDGVWLGKDL